MRTLPALVLAALLLAPLAQAHVTKTAGAYSLKVGWDREPPATQERNAITLQVWKTATMEGVSSLTGALTVTVSIAGQSKTLDMEESDEAPGNYSAPILLTRAGIYTVHVQGAIGGTQASQDFQLEEVKDINDDAFPARSATAGPTNAELQSEYQQLRADVDKLQQQQSKRLPDVGVAGLAVVALAAALLLAGRRRAS